MYTTMHISVYMFLKGDRELSKSRAIKYCAKLRLRRDAALMASEGEVSSCLELMSLQEFYRDRMWKLHGLVPWEPVEIPVDESRRNMSARGAQSIQER